MQNTNKKHKAIPWQEKVNIQLWNKKNNNARKSDTNINQEMYKYSYNINQLYEDIKNQCCKNYNN